MIGKILEYILGKLSFRVWSSEVPEGRRLGGIDIPQVKDQYVMVEVRYGTRLILFGHLQYN